MKKLFQKYYWLNAAIVGIFIVVGFMSSRLLMRMQASSMEDHHAVFYAKLLDGVSSGQRENALEKIRSWNPPWSLALLNEDGKVLAPNGTEIPFEWNTLQKPVGDYEYIAIHDQKSGLQTLVRLPGSPAQYLYANVDRMRRGHNNAFFWSVTPLVVSVLLGIAFSMLLLFRSLRGKAELADSVIAELQRGNLKARFPIKKMDEFGQAMTRFNLMADEIERLVEQLKAVESSRMRLLQELAHDLRTPVTSMKNLIETAIYKGERLEKSVREELLTLSLKEIEYFQRLVEDLLVLAKVSEPRYHPEQKSISLQKLLQDEVDAMHASYLTQGKKVSVQKRISGEAIQVAGDEHLLRRMIRNTLDNAFSFAEKELVVSLQPERNLAKLIVENDGEPFSEEALYSYGERRVSRSLENTKTGRLSVGLGSVIIKTVVQAHGGSVQVSNRDSVEDKKGSRVILYLPLS